MAVKKNKLMPKRRKFVAEFARTGHITESAKRAGYSKKTAYSIGSELLKKPEIIEAVEDAIDHITEAAQLKAIHVLAELKKIAFVDLSKAFADDGTLLHPRQMPEDVRAALAGLDTQELKTQSGFKFGHIKKVRLMDKVKSLELIGKTFGMFKDVVDTNVTGTIITATQEDVDAAIEKARAKVKPPIGG